MRSRSRHRFFPQLGLFGLGVLLYAATASATREHLVYFPNTAYELNIYKIHGKNQGKTLMLIGGIQGNEPGGFLSAELYADMRLEKGNLIVVPRANFYSIITDQRDPHGDMNRKFTPVDMTASMEDKIVTILKALIKESDYLLNLHDGSGYYYPTYIDKWRNPNRFGQSIIADCDQYVVPGSNKVIKEEVQTNLSQKQEIFLQINGQKIKTGEVRRVKDLFPNSSNKQTIEIKNGPMLLGSFVIEIG